MKSSATLKGGVSRSRLEFLHDVRRPRLAGKRAGLQVPLRQARLRTIRSDLPIGRVHLTRSELSIMENMASEMGRQVGPDAMLVEYGSGSSVKTRYLLDALTACAAYVPVDISEEH